MIKEYLLKDITALHNQLQEQVDAIQIQLNSFDQVNKNFNRAIELSDLLETKINEVNLLVQEEERHNQHIEAVLADYSRQFDTFKYNVNQDVINNNASVLTEFNAFKANSEVVMSAFSSEVTAKLAEFQREYRESYAVLRSELMQQQSENKENLNNSLNAEIEELKTSTREFQNNLRQDFIDLANMLRIKYEESDKATDEKLDAEKVRLNTLMEKVKRQTEGRVNSIINMYNQIWAEKNNNFSRQMTEFFDHYESNLTLFIRESISSELMKQSVDSISAMVAAKVLESFNQCLNDMGIQERQTIIDAISAMLTPQLLTLPSAKDDEKIESLPKDALLHENHGKLKTCILSGSIPMLVGPAGTGKSTAVMNIAKELGLRFYMANRIQNTFELVGFVNANGNYVTTQFYEAYTKGGLFLFDEVDASSPEALVTINAAIAQGKMSFPGQPMPIPMHPNFKVVCAGNTYGTGATMEYTGRNKLDAATLDRFMMIEWGYDYNLEYQLIKNKNLLNMCWVLRRVCAEIDKKIIVSTRGIQTLEKMLKQNNKTHDFEEDYLIRLKFFQTTKKETLKQIVDKCKTEPKLQNNPYLQVLVNLVKK